MEWSFRIVTKMKYVCFFLLAITFFSCTAQDKKGVSLVDSEVFHKAIAAYKTQLIDVRTPKEFLSGHIENALNIHLYDADFENRINKMDKLKPIYVYCKAGGRSAEAVAIMREQGFAEIIELKGGIDAWDDLNLPLVK